MTIYRFTLTRSDGEVLGEWDEDQLLLEEGKILTKIPDRVMVQIEPGSQHYKVDWEEVEDEYQEAIG